jgi:CheY-like chemotaxis protein
VPKILAVDDSATMRRIYEMTFAGQDGFEVVTVDSGDAAVRHALERGADLVLADASMNGTSGYEVAKALRDTAGGANIPVVLLASQQAPFDAERARASGIDDHILKPFDTQSLIDKARDVMGRRGAGRAPSAAPRPVAAAPVAVAAPASYAAPAVARPASAVPAAVGGSVAAPRPAATRSTASFGAPAGAKPPVAVPPSAIVGVRAPMAAPIALTARKPEPAPQVSAAAAAASNEMAGKLSGMGLSPEQVQGVLSLSREVIERVVWEVVPDMAERIIRDEIRRLTQ